MQTSPLTHHEMIPLVEPFARQGRHVDMGASDRASRRIVFKPRAAQAATAGAAAWHETLELDCRSEVHFVLVRRLAGPGGSIATLEASGPDAGTLLESIDGVPPARHFSVGANYLIARSYSLDLPRGMHADRSAGAAPLVLQHAQLQVDGMTVSLTLRLPNLRSVAAELALIPAPGPAPDLPEDLLAVLGWDWARLIRTAEGWTSKLRLRGTILRRSRTAEAALERMGVHLARVLAESPEQFHDRHRLARWAVVARRGIPALTAVSMVVGALLLPRLTDPANTGLWMALHYVPIGLLAVAFSLQELPQFEIPPWPRRSRAPSWTQGMTAGSEAAR